MSIMQLIPLTKNLSGLFFKNIMAKFKFLFLIIWSPRYPKFIALDDYAGNAHLKLCL
jgi:hypothetical protein